MPEAQTDRGVTGVGETYHDRDEVAAMRSTHPGWTQPSLPRW
jgi:hypothetical protein